VLITSTKFNDRLAFKGAGLDGKTLRGEKGPLSAGIGHTRGTI